MQKPLFILHYSYFFLYSYKTMVVTKKFTKDVKDKLRKGAVGVIPTDTLYGIVANALNKASVERVYGARKRTPTKPMIILLPGLSYLKRFGISVSAQRARVLKRFWPGKISIIFPVPRGSFSYLHRGTNSLAFRVPDNPRILKVLQRTGPLVAPSANLEGKKPAATVKEAFDYFDDSIDFYVDSGRLYGKPSTLISFPSDHEVVVLREGSIPAKTIQKVAGFDRKIVNRKT